MNFLRVIRHTNEELRWAEVDINRPFTNMSEAGELEGMLGASQGRRSRRPDSKARLQPIPAVVGIVNGEWIPGSRFREL